MASNIEDLMNKAYDNAIQELDKKMGMAFKRAMARMQEGLYDVMLQWSVKNYYNGYFPISYERTHQLYNAININLEDTSNSGMFAFNVIPEYDETKMDHSHYTINVTYSRRKNGKKTGAISRYKYKINLKNKPNEERILQMALEEGYHPSVGHMGTEHPIWTGNGDEEEGVLLDALIKYVVDNAQNFFNEEFNKL